MDTQQRKTPDQVAQDLHRIKTHMPETYKAIQQQAASIGNLAFALVRRGCAGESNTFYAFEAGHVVGTPFTIPDVAEPLATAMVRYGVAHAVVWGQRVTEGAAS